MLFGKSYKIPGELNTDPTGRLENEKQKNWLRIQKASNAEKVENIETAED